MAFLYLGSISTEGKQSESGRANPIDYTLNKKFAPAFTYRGDEPHGKNYRVLTSSFTRVHSHAFL